MAATGWSIMPRELGDYLIGELKKLPRVKEVRGRGLMIGVELFEDAAPLRRKLLFDEKIFVGSSAIRIRSACFRRSISDASMPTGCSRR